MCASVVHIKNTSPSSTSHAGVFRLPVRVIIAYTLQDIYKENHMLSNSLYPTNGQIVDIAGTSYAFWDGVRCRVSFPTACKLNDQVGRELDIPVKKLAGQALNWAVARVLGMNPQVGERLHPMPDAEPDTAQHYCELVTTVFVYANSKLVDENEFDPVNNYAQGGPLLDQYRISTEIAGDGWGALFNDCFDRKTQSKVLIGHTRLEAGLRCIIMNVHGDSVYVPAELVDLKTRSELP